MSISEMLRWALMLLAGCGRGAAPAQLEPQSTPVERAITVDAGAPTWPMALAPLRALDLPNLPVRRRYRILIDAGHGAPGNEGNTSVHCEKERDVMRDVAAGLALQLSQLGPFDVRLSRKDDEEPTYAERRTLAESWPADAVVSLHSDARGDATPYSEAGCDGWRNDSEPGFSVLWSNEGRDAVTQKRQRLAHAMTDALTQAGFPPYGGADYVGLYDGDDEHPGTFANGKTHGRRIWFLRKLQVPTVIIETHHALDFEEVQRWRELRTRAVFATAVANGLLEFVTTQGH